VLLQSTIFKAALVIGASYFYVLLLMWMCRCVDSQVKNASCPLAIREFSDGDDDADDVPEEKSGPLAGNCA